MRQGGVVPRIAFTVLLLLASPVLLLGLLAVLVLSTPFYLVGYALWLWGNSDWAESVVSCSPAIWLLRIE